MRIVKSFAVLAAPLFFGLISLGANTAQAAPCCSAPMCQTDPPHPWCALCSPSCVDEEVEMSLPEDPAYDDADAVCHNATPVDPSALEDAAPVAEDVAQAS
jgi:hypothetical protein